MGAYVKLLEEQRYTDAARVTVLTALELPNLFALLEHLEPGPNADEVVYLTTRLFSLFQSLGKPRLLDRVMQAHAAAEATMNRAWNHGHFNALGVKVEYQLARGQLHEALNGADHLLRRSEAAGNAAYAGADYDLAMAHLQFARVLQTAHRSERALQHLDKAQGLFQAVGLQRPSSGAAWMVSVCSHEQADCLRALGRLDEAAGICEEAIRRDEQTNDQNGAAVGRGQLGTIRLQQRRFEQALNALVEACRAFERLGGSSASRSKLAPDRRAARAGRTSQGGGGCLSEFASTLSAA